MTVVPWQIHFAQVGSSDTVPAVEFLDAVPVKVAGEMHAVLAAVAEAPPPAFSGGGKWEAMHGDMAGMYEVRVQAHGANYRLFCILDRGQDLGGPSIVCVDGLTKPPRAAASAKDYRRVKRFADEFRRSRQVMK